MSTEHHTTITTMRDPERVADAVIVRQCEFLARAFGACLPAHNCHDFYLLQVSDQLQIRYFTDNYTTIKYQGRTVFECKSDGFRLVRQDDNLWVADLFGWESLRNIVATQKGEIAELQSVNEGLREAVKDYARRITLLERKMEVARDAARILAQGVQADYKTFSLGFEAYPYSDTYDPDNDDYGENEDVCALIAFLNVFRDPGQKAITHYKKDPEEQETLARQSATLGW